MYGFISKGNSQVSFYVQVEGYPQHGYLYYSKRDAIKEYRTRYGLVRKHITFYDWR